MRAILMWVLAAVSVMACFSSVDDVGDTEEGVEVSQADADSDQPESSGCTDPELLAVTPGPNEVDLGAAGDEVRLEFQFSCPLPQPDFDATADWVHLRYDEKGLLLSFVDESSWEGDTFTYTSVPFLDGSVSRGGVVEVTILPEHFGGGGVFDAPLQWRFRVATRPRDLLSLKRVAVPSPSETRALAAVALDPQRSPPRRGLYVGNNGPDHVFDYQVDFEDFTEVELGVFLGDESTDIAFADPDDDGRPDAIVTQAQGAARLIAYGTPLMTASPQSLGVTEHAAVATADVNRDGYVDLILVGAGADDLLLGDGVGGFEASRTFGEQNSVGVAVADLDNDDDAEWVVAEFGRPATVWTWDGEAVVPYARQTTFPGGGSLSVAVGDLDGDGFNDVVLGKPGENPFEIWRNDGEGAFSLEETLPITTARAVALGDVNGDNRLDLVVASAAGDALYLNEGAFVFTRFTEVPFDSQSHDVALADFDDDGGLDIAFGDADPEDPNVVWFNRLAP